MKDFIVKTSGVQHFKGMKRSSPKGKISFHLLLPSAQKLESTLLGRWAKLLTRGAELYGERNWEGSHTKEEMERFKESAMRHFLQWFTGETDEDHAAAVLFNINGYEYVKERLDGKRTKK